MFTLTYILTFSECDEELSGTKTEIFETEALAAERADEIDAEYHEHGLIDCSNFRINGERFMPIMERIFWDAFDEYESRMTDRNHPDSRDEEERLAFEAQLKAYEEDAADSAINIAKDQNSNDADYLPF
jgi:hypothetical protein